MALPSNPGITEKVSDTVNRRLLGLEFSALYRGLAQTTFIVSEL